MSNTRRSFIQNVGLGIATLLLPQDVFSLDTHLKTGEFELIRKNVGYYTNRGGTIGWLKNEAGIVIIDSQFPESAKDLIQEVQKNSDLTIDYLINTHHHADHTSGNIAFEGIASQIIAHENAKANQKRVSKERNIEEKQLYPTKTFIDEWNTKIGDEIIKSTYHGRGHTNGDIITHFENANVAHMGDLVFNRRFPYIDKSAGASINNWINILDDAVKRFDEETKFIFGHAGEGYEIVGDKQDIKAFTNYLEQLMLQVEKAITAGKSLDEMKSEITLIAGAPQWNGKGIERSLEAAYLELTMEK